MLQAWRSGCPCVRRGAVLLQWKVFRQGGQMRRRSSETSKPQEEDHFSTTCRSGNLASSPPASPSFLSGESCREKEKFKKKYSGIRPNKHNVQNNGIRKKKVSPDKMSWERAGGSDDKKESEPLLWGDLVLATRY